MTRIVHTQLWKLGKDALAGLLGIALAVLVIEGAARMMAATLGLSPYMKYDPVLGWTAQANVSKRHKSSLGEFDVTYETNRYGHRGAAYAYHKPRGIRRIVILGDSNGFGWGVRQEDTFAGILDREMECVEVVNLSLSGYGIDQSYLRFIAEGTYFEPDIVILQITPNDFEEILHPFFNQKAKPQFVIAGDGSLSLVNIPVRLIGARAEEFDNNSLPLPFKDWLGWNSYAFNFVNEKYHQWKRSRREMDRPPNDMYSAASVHLFNAIVGNAKKYLDDLGVVGIVVQSAQEVSEGGHISAQHFPILDLYPTFVSASSGDPALLYFADGYHWNAAGHRIVARELESAIGGKVECDDN